MMLKRLNIAPAIEVFEDCRGNEERDPNGSQGKHRIPDTTCSIGSANHDDKQCAYDPSPFLLLEVREQNENPNAPPNKYASHSGVWWEHS